MKNLEKYTNVPDRYEVARLVDTNCILVHTFHQRDYGHGFNHHWNIDEIQSKMDWQSAPYIFIFGQEANCKYWVNQDSRIHVWDNSVECMPRHHTFMWWWEQVRQVEADQQALHRLNSPLESTPKYIFDFLVQVRYKHRNFVLEQIEKCKLQDKILLPADTYVTGCPDTINDVEYKDYVYNQYNQQANVSCFVPYALYNQSWFSILTESRYYQNKSTEKTAKCLLAKRMFIFFGAPGYLADLRALGYKTFSSIIDESYDYEMDQDQRWKMAWTQVERLCRMDPATVYKKVQPILAHNQSLFIQTDWYEKANREIQLIINGDK